MNPQTILNFWFGDDPNIIQNQKLWFEVNFKTDEIIKNNFEIYLTKAEKNELNHWCVEYEKGQFALVIIFDQIAKFIHRGTSLMFQNEFRAVELAYDIIESKRLFNFLNSIEKYFLYATLLNTENIKMAEIGLAGVKDLYDTSTNDKKGKIAFDLLFLL